MVALIDVEIHPYLKGITRLNGTTDRFFAEIDVTVTKLDHRGGLREGHPAERKDQDKHPYDSVKNGTDGAIGFYGYDTFQGYTDLGSLLLQGFMR